VYIKLCVVDYEEDRAKPPRKVQKINSLLSLCCSCALNQLTQILPRGKKEFEKNNLIFIPHVNCPLIEKRQVTQLHQKGESQREKEREKEREERQKQQKCSFISFLCPRRRSVVEREKLYSFSPQVGGEERQKPRETKDKKDSFVVSLTSS